MITLFNYQQVALDLIVNAFRTRAMALAVMATGLGKTIVAAFWAKEELRKKRKGLFLCHDNGILEQAMGEFKKVIGDKAKFAPFFGADKDFDADKADMVFASFQTYANWKIAFYENDFDFIIVDESHHGQARTFKEVILYFQPKKLLGITATPDRMDLKDIREIFGEEVVNYSLEEAIAKGWLTQVDYYIINDDLNHWKLKNILKGVLEKGERVSIKQLNETIFIAKRDEEIAKVIQEYSGSSKKTIIFCENIDHAEKFKEYLPGALTYHSKVAGGAKENRRRLDAFREGTLQYILAVDKFNEGIDVPDAELVVFLRCTDSKVIFYQQLGRGLRKVFGKEKVTVLDFVANCERLIFIKELAQRTKEFAGNHFELSDAIIQVSGEAFDFIFSDEQVDIINLVKRINEPFYETWQEASKAAISLEIKSSRDYFKLYRIDPKLPSQPYQYYKDFPGWNCFLYLYYPTWQEAGIAAKNIGVSNYRSYEKLYKKDPRLPGNPYHFYKDFPGWVAFLNRSKREFYLTWQEASYTTIILGIENQSDYSKKYKSDEKLPSDPPAFYKDFPGWMIFLNKCENKFYPTWQDAKEIVNKLKIVRLREYKKRYKEDSKLHSNPASFYSDFPGFSVFLGNKEEGGYYPTWQEAGIAAKKLKINSVQDYKNMRKLDIKLPANPHYSYKNFPGWYEFLGKTKKTFYPTWQESSLVAINCGIKGKKEYRCRHNENSKLPSNPDSFYNNFPGWDKFLGKEEKKK